MDKLDNLIANLRDFMANVSTCLEAATMGASDTIIDMNIGQLYDRGEDANGAKITPGYAPVTVQIKRAKGQPTNRVTLRDTFDFQASFYIQYNADGFEIKADDWKTERLQEKYGKAILGLQDENLKYVCENCYKPALLKELRRAVYGN